MGSKERCLKYRPKMTRRRLKGEFTKRRSGNEVVVAYEKLGTIHPKQQLQAILEDLTALTEQHGTEIDLHGERNAETLFEIFEYGSGTGGKTGDFYLHLRLRMLLFCC